jgi:hypothetical protein
MSNNTDFDLFFKSVKMHIIKKVYKSSLKSYFEGDFV